MINISNYQNTDPLDYYRGAKDLPSLVLGMFFGLMIVMAVYNLFIYFSLKDKTYLLYVGTTVFSILTSLATNGIGDQFLWPNYIDLDSWIYLVFAGISMFFSSRFASVFLKLKENHKSLDKLMWGIAFLSLLLSVLSCFLTVEQVTPFGRWLVLLSFPSYIFVAIYSYNKGLKIAKFYIIAWAPYVLGLVITTMVGADWLTPNLLTLFSMEIGGALEIVLLSLALAYRIKEIQEENASISIQLQEYISKVIILEEKIQSKNTPEKKILEKKVEKIALAHQLTERETDVFMCLAKGLNNQKIADELFVSINTVKFHTRNIYQKLDIKKRNEINTRILFNQ